MMRSIINFEKFLSITISTSLLIFSVLFSLPLLGHQLHVKGFWNWPVILREFKFLREISSSLCLSHIYLDPIGQSKVHGWVHSAVVGRMTFPWRKGTAIVYWKESEFRNGLGNEAMIVTYHIIHPILDSTHFRVYWLFMFLGLITF